jgi:hypothetical protein
VRELTGGIGLWSVAHCQVWLAVPGGEMFESPDVVSYLIWLARELFLRAGCFGVAAGASASTFAKASAFAKATADRMADRRGNGRRKAYPVSKVSRFCSCTLVVLT